MKKKRTNLQTVANRLRGEVRISQKGRHYVEAKKGNDLCGIFRFPSSWVVFYPFPSFDRTQHQVSFGTADELVSWFQQTP